MADRSVTVRLKIDNSDFIRGLAQSSAAAKAFQKSLTDDVSDFGDDLDESADSASEFSTNITKARESTKSYNATIIKASGSTNAFGKAFRSANADARHFRDTLNTSNDRMSFLVQTSLALGPALVPAFAALVPATAGFATALGFAASAAGVGVLAFQGVGKALTALNDAEIEPTAEHLETLRQAFETLGPAGQDFVLFLQQMREPLQELQNVAQAGLFPGLQQGITEASAQLPLLESVIESISRALGEISLEAGQAFSSPFWTGFFEFLRTDARQILTDFASALGHLIEGFSAMIQAFGPLSSDFIAGFDNMARSFSRWAQNLDQTEGFQEFLAFIRESGPVVLDTLAALGNALVEVAKASADVGISALQIITALANALAAVAASPAGPALIGAAAGLAAVSRAIALFNVVGGSSLAGVFKGLGANAQAARIGFGALGVGLIALDSQVDNSNQSMNTLLKTAEGAALGFAVGGPWGAAIGGGIGLLTSFTGASDEAADAQERLDNAAAGLATTLNAKTGKATKETLQGIADSLQAVGASDIAEDFGIGFSTLIAAVAGSEPDLKAVNEQLDLTVANAKSALDAAIAVEAASSHGSPEQLAEITRLRGVYEDTKDGAAALRTEIEAQSEVVSAARAEWERMKEAGESTAEAWRRLQGSVEAESAAVRQAVLDHNALADALLQDQLGMIGFRNAVRDAQEAAKGFSGSIFSGTEAADEQKTNLIGVASAWNEMTPKVQASVGAYKNARKAFIQTAEAMGVSSKRAKQLADNWLDLPDASLKVQASVKDLVRRYNDLPKDVRTDIKANGVEADATVKSLMRKYEGLSKAEAVTILEADDKASPKIEHVKVQVADLDGDTATVHVNAATQAAAAAIHALDSLIHQPRTITVNTVNTTTGDFDALGGGRRRKADGGLLSGPGGPRSDSIPILASNGEFIVNAAATRRHLSLLRSLNTQKFASGGKVGRDISSSDISRLAFHEDDVSIMRDLADALREMRSEAKDVIEAEKDVKAAREASKQAAHALAQVEDTSSKRYRDRAKNQRIADRELEQAENALSRQRDQLTEATQKWKDIQAELIAQAKAVQDAILSSGAIFGGEGASVTVGGMLAKLHEAARKGRQFNQNIAELRAAGLDEDLVQQLLDEAGSPAAQAAAENLANASKRQIKHLNTAQGRLEGIALRSGQLATVGGPGGIQVNARFTGDIYTTDVKNLDRKLERRVMRAVRLARGR